MSIEIKPLDGFKKDFKKLAKKYRHIKTDIEEVIVLLKENPKLGIALQHSCYKIRVPNSSTPTGKSGGFRVIYYFIDKQNQLYLMNIYSKTQKDNISDKALLELLKTHGLSS